MKKAREDYLRERAKLRYHMECLHYLDPENYPPVTPEKWLYHNFNHD